MEQPCAKDLVENNFPKSIVMKSGLFTPLFEKDDCMGRDLLLQSLHSRHPWRSCRRGNAGTIAEGAGEIY
jgi:hypothetical protein